MSMLSDRARVRLLRRDADLRTVLEQLRTDGWSPRRAAIALELPERFLLRILSGPQRKAARADPRVRELAGELEDHPQVGSALEGLVLDSRSGLWPVDWWPLPYPVVAFTCRRLLAVKHGEAQWCPTPLGVKVAQFRSNRPGG